MGGPGAGGGSPWAPLPPVRGSALPAGVGETHVTRERRGRGVLLCPGPGTQVGGGLRGPRAQDPRETLSGASPSEELLPAGRGRPSSKPAGNFQAMGE